MVHVPNLVIGGKRPSSPISRPFCHLYNLREWRRQSRQFLAFNPFCECGKPAHHTDHKRPHQGDLSLFWDPSNWQPLCRSCHARKSKQELVNHELAAEAGYSYGVPLIRRESK